MVDPSPAAIAATSHKCTRATPFPIDELPELVLLDIFLRLPIRSILQCKCVCRAWNNLLSGSNSSSPVLVPTNRKCTTLLPSICWGVEDLYFIETTGRRDDGFTVTPFNPKVLHDSWEWHISFVGSCNGLVCLVHNPPPVYSSLTVVYIINPLLGECVKLPGFKESKLIGKVESYGFGFSVSANEYKVVRIVRLRSGKQAVGQILTVGVHNDGWRNLEVTMVPRFPQYVHGVNLNGSIHWISLRGNNDDGRVNWIFALDIGKEISLRIELPSLLSNGSKYNKKLGVLGDILCVNEFFTDHLVIWKMTKYGVVQSWRRDVVLTLFFIPRQLRHFTWNVIAVLGDGEILLSSAVSKILLSCNKDNEGSVNFLTKDNWPPGQMVTFVPSLCSIKDIMREQPDNQQEDSPSYPKTYLFFI